MKASLHPGVARVSRITIDRDRTIGFMGDEGRVYATPRLVSDIEYPGDQMRVVK
jgi:fluoroacetyl-CoA thioesterase